MNNKELIKMKKKNAKLYPIYKMFSGDLLFYYAIAFVFLVQVKGFSPAQVMLTDALYPIFKIILNIPVVTLIDKLGKKKSLIVANAILAIYLVLLLFCNGILNLIFIYMILACAFTIKSIVESNILYDSVSHKKGKGMFAKIEEIGARNYYFLDGITSLATGFLFVVNGYLPMIISLMFVIISIALSTCFKEINVSRTSNNKTLKAKILDYKNELTSAFKFIFKSHRLQAIMIFTLFFDGLIYTSYTLRESMLTELGISAEYFAIILSSLTIVSGVFASLQEKIHNKFRNKALTFIVSIYVPVFILIGIISMLNISWIIKIVLILLMYVIQYALQSPYYTLSSVYIKNFTSLEIRTKIASTFDLIRSISQFSIALFASYLLTVATVGNNFIIIGCLFLIIMSAVLIYIKPRFGLKPENYKKEDIKFMEK